MRAQTLERVDRRRAEHQRVTLEGVEVHPPSSPMNLRGLGRGLSAERNHRHRFRNTAARSDLTGIRTGISLTTGLGPLPRWMLTRIACPRRGNVSARPQTFSHRPRL